MVIVPLVSGRLVALHQQARLAAHVSIEILHPQRFAPLGPVLELLVGGNESVILQQRDLQRAVLQRLDQPKLTRSRRKHLGRVPLLGAAQQLATDGLAVLGVVQLGIIDSPAILPQPRRKLAHGGQDQRDLLGVMGHIRPLFRHLGHDNNVAVLIGLAQGRHALGQLIPKDQNQSAHHGTSAPE